MRRPVVRIFGDGIAGCAATQALRAQSIHATIQSPPYHPSSLSLALVLDETAIRLIGEVFGATVFARAWQLRYRIVRWGSAERVVAQPAVSVRSGVLAEAIRRVAEVAAVHCDDGEYDWTLFAAAVSPRTDSDPTFGRRVTPACEVGLPSGEDTAACQVESAHNGWVFLTPLGNRRAALQVTLPRPPSCDAEKAIASITADCSPLLRCAGKSIETPVAVLNSAPWKAHALGGTNWIGMGPAAVRFDPICGDGTAQSLRTGLLAAACTSMALIRNLPMQAVDHYERRVGRTFDAHLLGCAQSYAGGNFGPRWDDELSSIKDAARTTESTDRWKPSVAFRDGVMVDTD